MATVKSHLERGNQNKISVEELQAIAAKEGKTIKLWDMKTQRHPDSVGNNRSRFGFTHDPTYNPRGIFFQKATKKMTLVALLLCRAALFGKNRVVKWVAWRALATLTSTIHTALIHDYDKDIFVYDDDRINMINDFLDAFIKKYFQHAYPYKHNFMMQVKDILCGMLAKEDAYYRARGFHAYNEFQEFYPGKIPLHKLEKENIKKWH